MDDELQTRHRSPKASLLVALACVAVSGCASTRLEGADLTGTAGFACGLDDGLATLGRLQDKAAPSTWWVFSVVGEPPDRLEGEYPINDSLRNGSATLRVCDNALSCTNAGEGIVVVTGQHHRRIDGRLNYRLPGQEQESRAFSASIEGTDAICP